MSDPAQRAKAIAVVDSIGPIRIDESTFDRRERLVDAITAALAASPVAVWSDKQPVKEGWYWYRNNLTSETVACVTQLGVMVIGSKTWHAHLLPGEWCPIPPPQEGGT